MTFPSIRIEGAILSGDLLAKVERDDFPGQKPADFGLPGGTKVKDEIARAWAEAQSLWAIYRRRLDNLTSVDLGTSETRNLWIVPFLGLLGYQLERPERAEVVLDKTYALSHRLPGRDGFPVHIVGPRHGDPSVPPDRSTLDVKAVAGPRMSPHALLQEYLNLTEHLYGLVTNGLSLRLLRDSSRLIKLSYVEFDLERIFTEQLFADFAVLFRLLHVSRLPAGREHAPESWVEHYHQDTLEFGSRIRDGLSRAVEDSIKSLANGFLNHPQNQPLKDAITSNKVNATEFYKWQLRLIYRLLFLMVTEERDLIFPKSADRKQRDIYYRYYSLNRLRKLSEKRHFADKNFQDAWAALKSNFCLFQDGSAGKKLGIAPLAGDLFGYEAIGLLNECQLDNQTLLECFRNLSTFEHPDTRQRIRVNYGALNVEEFGSVYEGLLEYDPVITPNNHRLEFSFVKGKGRASTGSHYTPDELVQPLIQHSLDYLIADKLKEEDKEQALLSLRVCDVACGSGHILLNAARRIATELAIVRTGEDQPSPLAFREAVRDVIRHCIYGVDLNPLAVELCKVALWLEAHVPGESLNFLDHHIKCGNAIVGLAHEAELQRGIPEEAFNRLPDDDKDIAAEFRKRNKYEKKEAGQQKLDLAQSLRQELQPVSREYAQLAALPDHSPADYEKKKAQFDGFSQRKDLWRLRTLANLQVAQFFIPKTPENKPFLCTEEEYRDYLTGKRHPQSQAVAYANALWAGKHWFHWFIEFPDIFERGGFDCILGNPPYLGGSRISTVHGNAVLCYLKDAFPLAHDRVDLVAYFFRRDYDLIRTDGFVALITTNSISQGDTRAAGLEYVQKHCGQILFAIPSIAWPGEAAVRVSLVSVAKSTRLFEYYLNKHRVEFISSHLDATADLGEPHPLKSNESQSFIGSVVIGEGFILSLEQGASLIEQSPANREVVFPYLGGRDLNSSPTNSASRCIINFFDWPVLAAKAKSPDCFEIVERLVKPERDILKDKGYREKWWQYGRRGVELYESVKSLDRIIVLAKVSRTVAPCFVNRDHVFSDKVIVFALDRWWHFAILQSCFHYEWAWKYCTTMKSDLSYMPVAIYQTFPFLVQIKSIENADLDSIGERYHEHRRELMLKLQLGLTKTYNLFHDRELSVELVAKESKQPVPVAESALADLLQLRKLHVQMDQDVLAAYGWHQPSDAGPAIALHHDFYEVDYLPENDRVRYTIHPDARKEILKRLLQLNHKLYAEEEAKGLHKPKKTWKQSVTQENNKEQPSLGF